MRTAEQKTEKGIQVQKPALPKGGGSVQGMGETFAPNAFNGSSAMSIPVPASPCRDFEPQLSLNYSSGNGNSPFGLGWELSTPEIVRRTSLKIPTYDGTDTFLYTAGDYLAPRLTPTGEPMTSTTQIGNHQYTVYFFIPCKEAEFDKIERYVNNANPSDDFWKITSAENTVSVFGKSDAAKIYDPENPSQIFKWLLEETYNDKGDHQVYVYQKENSDNVPPDISETSRDQQTQTYPSSVYYGNFTPVTDGSIVTGESSTAFNPDQWHFQIIFDYGVYNIDPTNPDPHTIPSGNAWPCRQDPFSDYSSGFEIRTYRLCQNILLFHRFDLLAQNAILVSALRLNYSASVILTQLISATHTGYRYKGASYSPPYEVKSIPELSFSYTKFPPLQQGYVPHAVELLVDVNQQAIRQAQEAPYYQLIDLYGEGIPGILYQDGQSVFYRSALKVTETSVEYADPVPVNFPIAGKISPEHILADITGSGRLGLALTSTQQAGFWEMDDSHHWKNFIAFQSFPTNYQYPLNDFTDITGDGVADVVLISDTRVQYNASLNEQGFDAAQQAPNTALVPASKGDSPTEVLFYADMIGSGLSQRVRITKNTVECWPNLGYGNFGEKVAMNNAPDFGPDFDTDRLLWADVDGSGFTDLAYIQSTHIDIYFNQSGNGFSATPLSIPLPENWDNHCQVSFADIKGNGTNCLVFTQTHPQPKIWYYDFNQIQNTDDTFSSQKPYLLSGINNNMGAVTSITYAGSTKFYLEDKSAGIPWITHLPYPVNVIESVTRSDEVSLSSVSTAYQYSHGYYDSHEKEFRGFGRVDTIDAKEFKQFIAQNDGTLAAYNSPDTFTRTWYHTGAFSEYDALMEQYKKEFWQGDNKALPVNYACFKYLSTQPDQETLRNAYRTLYGSVIRSETYGNDASPWQQIPYTVTESEFEAREVQRKFGNRYSSFLLHIRQSVSYDYERNAADPRVEHSFILDTDFYDHVLQSCTVNYPRRSAAIPPGTDPQTLAQQIQLRVSADITTVFNSNEADEYWNIPPPEGQTASGGYLIGADLEAKMYEIANLTPDLPGGYFSFSAMKEQVANALSSGSNINLLEWERDYYFDAVNQKENNLGTIVCPALHHRSESATFAIADLNTTFASCLDPQQLTQLLTANPGINGAHGGYISFDSGSDEGNYYWNPGGSQGYNDASQFFLPSAFYDPFQYPYVYWGATDPDEAVKTVYEYDPYNLFVQNITDPLDNTIQISTFDYQSMQALTIADINGNTTSVLVDALGVVIATSESGKQQGQPIGFTDLSLFTPFTDDEIDEAFANPSGILNEANWMTVASFFQYDLHSWKNNNIPVHFKRVVRNYYYGNTEQQTDNPLYQFEVIYQDGFGRIAQQKIYYDGTRQWQADGTVRYDNKGQAVEQFEPWFDATDQYNLEVSAISELLFYDAPGRLVLTKRCNSIDPDAEDFFTKTLFGYPGPSSPIPTYTGYLNTKLYAGIGVVFQPCAWNALQYDKNDAILDSAYQPAVGNNVDIDAWNKAKVFANTPFQSIEDNMGNLVQEGQLNVPDTEQNNNYFTFNILGEELTSSDQRLHPQQLSNFQYSYDLDRQRIKTISADGGTQWQLQDVMGNILFNCDSRNTQQYYSYDLLRRFSSLYVENNSLPQPLAQTTRITIYGDSQNSGVPYFSNPQQLNLRGEAVIVLDEAGLTLYPSFDIHNHSLLTAQWIKSDYRNEANWNTITNSVISSLITLFQGKYRPSDFTNLKLPSGLTSLLDAPAYVSVTETNAAEQTISTTDADGNISSPQYYSNGWIKGLTVIAGPLVQAANPQAPAPGFFNAQYNEKGQRTSVNYANNTTTSYTYDDYSYELMRIKTIGNANTIIQDLHYHHDPVGNITSARNLAIPTVFFGNQQVDALSTYTYDSLYRLITATGREHQGLWQNVQANQNKFNESFLSTLFNANGQPVSNPQALQNYTQQFTYDAGGNLTRMQQLGNSAYTRNNTIAPDSNQMTESSVGRTPAILYYYDENGNMTTLDGCAYVTWNYRDNMQSAVTVDRSSVDDDNDAEYYVYNGSGQRVRKVHRQKTQTGWNITETLYVGGIEIRKSYAEGAAVNKEWHDVKLDDDNTTFCVWQYWVKGNVNPYEKKVKLRYQLTDVLQSGIYELDENANLITYEEYYPYGGTSIIAAQNQTEVESKHYHYSFKEKDNVTGLYYYGMRYYAPWLGRWTCTDPAGTIDGLNVYAFVGGNPVTQVDVGGMVVAKKTKTTVQRNDNYKNMKDFHKGFGPTRVVKGAKPVKQIKFNKKDKTSSRKKQKGAKKQGATQGLKLQINKSKRKLWPPKLVGDSAFLEKKIAKSKPTNFDPQFHKKRIEILHAIAHSHGGDETTGNATPGSSHANTEDIAHESAMKYLSTQGVEIRHKVTHYTEEVQNGQSKHEQLVFARHKYYLKFPGELQFTKSVDWVVNGMRGNIGKQEFDELFHKFLNAGHTPVTNLNYKPKTAMDSFHNYK
ncbi:MAG TPA: SpvB/TcaC N-terminal domain-containing protein [Chitinophagaceae bacterium]|nr:SpvB/TcaC N-terminal domain-containing protein [Chitinophagaceae bacterium]